MQSPKTQTKLKIFYRCEQSAGHNLSSSPSAQKPALFIKSLVDSDLPIEIVEFDQLSQGDIELAHDPNYVRDILNCTIPNGFDNRLRDIADTLPWTTGSFVAAALNAYKSSEITCSPTSGFHHSHFDLASGYCTFNGLIIAAIKLKMAGAKRIGIVDCDQHIGNGTDHIIKKLDLDYIKHYSYGYVTAEPKLVSLWLENFQDILKIFEDCDIILYQAGADPYINDPLGGVFTMGQLLVRDSILFNWSRSQGIPVAWNLAGGYTKPFSKVLEIHLNTVRACLPEALFREKVL